MIDIQSYVDPEGGLIRGEIFHNPEIYEQELQQLFSRSWVFLAHDSMIPKAGDYMQNYIGEDPVVIVRQKGGSVLAFLNQCRHRGMRLARADLGNAKNFTCTFHGWNYSIEGKLINVPFGDRIYDPQCLEDADLRRVRLHNYKGFIFGTWDETTPDFLTYLGDFRWYFDAYIDRFEGGLEVVGVHKWEMACNWKFNAEQPASDMYHAQTSHVSAIEARMPPPAPDGGDTDLIRQRKEANQNPRGNQISSPFGHGAGWFDTGAPTANPIIHAWHKAMEPQVRERLGDLRYYLPGHANIFPNFMFLNNYTYRVTHPRGPDRMEIWAWTLVPVAAPPEVKEAIRKDVLQTFSPGGMYEQDDAVNWEEEQAVLRGAIARRTPLNYRQMLGKARYDVGGYPGKTAGHVFAEEGARMLYRHWADLMSGASWEELLARKKAREQDERAHSQDAQDAQAA